MPAKKGLKRAGGSSAQKAEAPEDPLFPSMPKNLRIGGDIRPKRDLSRFVRWPKYVRIQRQRKVLYDRLKIPPAINQFHNPLDRAEAVPVFKLLSKYQPETKAQKKQRLQQLGEGKAAGRDGTSTPPSVLKFGLNHITYLVEQKKARLVAIASDVDPIELVCWLPALCRKMQVPYVIVNNKGRLGKLVHQKKAAAVALTTIRPEDKSALDKVVENANAKFADNVQLRRRWGGGVLGLKTQRRLAKREAALKAEEAKRAIL
eukprot:gb/GECG01002129.1/.p1 GENE.gb/GECG01002129.1/~~gb/GECG01002129.1/.p1  ORF type:complete len:260 (+),score=35.13 gb/GECG01002129.1/:1-780(+)